MTIFILNLLDANVKCVPMIQEKSFLIYKSLFLVDYGRFRLRFNINLGCNNCDIE